MTEPAFIVNADDLGLSISANKGIFRAFDEGCLTSASCAVTTPAFEHAVAGLKARPELGIGLHFSLSAGRAVADAARVSLLTDNRSVLSGRFASLFVRLRGPQRAAIQAQIGLELEAQIAKIRDSGVAIDHINGERHVHLIPGVFELVADAARRHGIGHIRLIDDVSLPYLRAADVAVTLLNGGWAKYAILESLSRRAARVLRRQNRAVAVRYASILFTGKMHEVMTRFWDDPPPGITELAVHPGAPGVESELAGTDNPSLEGYLRSADRAAELTACMELSGRPTAARLMTFAEASRQGRG